MVAVPTNRVCRSAIAAELSGVSPAALHKRISDERLFVPVIDCEGKGTRRWLSFQQVLALTKHRELLEIGVNREAARQVAQLIAAIEDVDALVDQGKHFLITIGEDVYDEPLSLAGVHEFMADMHGLARKFLPDEGRPVAVATVCDFGMTWRALRPLLVARAGQQKVPGAKKAR